MTKWLDLSLRLLGTLLDMLSIQLPIVPRCSGCHNLYCIVCEGMIVFYYTSQRAECIFTLLFLLHKICAVFHSFIYSLACAESSDSLLVFRSVFHSSLLCTLSLHRIPSASLPSFFTLSCHLFVGLPLSLVSKFIYNTFLGNSIFFHSAYMPKPM